MTKKQNSKQYDLEDRTLMYAKNVRAFVKKLRVKNENLLVIGNNDLLFRKDFLVELSKINFNDDTFVVAPNIITIDGYHQNPQLVTKQSEFKKFLLRLYFLNQYLAKIMRYAAIAVYKIIGRKDNLNSDRKMFIHQGNGACFILTSNFFSFYKKFYKNLVKKIYF